MDWKGNKHSIYVTLGASNHTEQERELNDYYATEPKAIDLLLTKEKPNHNIWECACGEGHLSKRLMEKGYNVVSTDIIDRGYKDMSAQQDFLSATNTPIKNIDILTNPPYKYAKEFVLKALDLLQDGCCCYMFLKLTFLEGKARFKEIFKYTPPKCVYVFSERVQCAKNGDFEKMRQGGGSAVAYAWMVWQKGYTGGTTIEWI